MNVNEIFPSKYLKASDLKNSEYTVRITNWSIEKLGEDSKLMLQFAGAKKGIICNKTNADTLTHLYGPDTDEWIGKEITLYPAMVKFGATMTEAIRMRAPPQKKYRPIDGPPPSQQRVATPLPAQAPMNGAEDLDAEEIPF